MPTSAVWAFPVKLIEDVGERRAGIDCCSPAASQSGHSQAGDAPSASA
jgi:hypothetical protein